MRRICPERSCHAIILGAGDRTRLALAHADRTDLSRLQAILDDDPRRWGERIAGIEVRDPGTYPLDQVNCVVITSEAHQPALTRRARELFGPDVSIEYVFDGHDTLAGRLNRLRLALDKADPGPLSDVSWHAADGLYADLHRRLEATPSWRYGPQRQLDEFRALGDQLRGTNHWPPARFLNFGCGRYQPVGLPLLALLSGASFAAATDLYPLLDERRSAEATLSLIERLILDPADTPELATFGRAELLSRIEALIDLDHLRQGRLTRAIHPNHMLYRVESIYDCTLPAGSFDVILSRAVFEHLPDVPDALAALSNLLQPGGVLLATIDFADHRVYQSLSRYRHYSHLIDLDEPACGGTNRLRYPQYPPLFEAAGLQIEQYAPDVIEPLPPGVRARLAEPYRSMNENDLAVVSATARLRKPG
jgi:SAM-dependent methyltransferase